MKKTMTLDEATEELINSSEYSEIAKQKNNEGSKYRVMRSRYKKGELKALAMVELLINHGFTVYATKTKI